MLNVGRSLIYQEGPMPGCSSCGGSTTGTTSVGYDPTGLPWIDVNEYGVRPIGDDPVDCAPYLGMFQAETMFLIGYGTDMVKLFRRGERSEAYAYAAENNLTFQHINVVELCNDRVMALLGA